TGGLAIAEVAVAVAVAAAVVVAVAVAVVVLLLRAARLGWGGAARLGRAVWLGPVGGVRRRLVRGQKGPWEASAGGRTGPLEASAGP
ncbi:unnamed protein product, partial [Closterium sp. NIES-53]